MKERTFVSADSLFLLSATASNGNEKPYERACRTVREISLLTHAEGRGAKERGAMPFVNTGAKGNTFFVALDT